MHIHEYVLYKISVLNNKHNPVFIMLFFLPSAYKLITKIEIDSDS